MGGCFLLFSEYFPVITGFGVCIDIRIHRHFSNFFLRTQYWPPGKNLSEAVNADAHKHMWRPLGINALSFWCLQKQEQGLKDTLCT